MRRNYIRSFSHPYDSIALDYDGTLVSLQNRGGLPMRRIINRLKDCLQNDLPIIIISGRGESLLKLRPLLSHSNQDSVFYAMYNGSRITQGLSNRPIVSNPIRLQRTFSLLRFNVDLARVVSKFSLKQYSIQLIPSIKSRPFMDALCGRVQTVLPRGLIARNSGYSVDIYPSSATKDICLSIVRKRVGRSLRFLRVGDQGHESGNDFELLDSPGSFSVGTLSSNPRTCFPVVDKNGSVIGGPVAADYFLTEMFEIT